MPFSAQEEGFRGGLSPGFAEKGEDGSSLPSWGMGSRGQERPYRGGRIWVGLEEESGSREAGTGRRADTPNPKTIVCSYLLGYSATGDSGVLKALSCS